MSSCAILGASGHGKVVAEMAELNGFQTISFFDDAWPEKKNLEHWAIEGDGKLLLESVLAYDLVVVAIGNNEVRYQKYLQLESLGAKMPALIHPQAVVSKYAKIGAGSVVMAGAIVSSFVEIGCAAIINTGATIDHDCEIQEGVHISPGANLAGNVEVGLMSWVGVGAQVKQLVSIGQAVIVGAGSTVVKDIPDYQVVVGTPAQTLIKS